MAVMMQTKQDHEWEIAQDINLSIDLISATKQHLKFLDVIDRNSWISKNGHTLQKAIYRYNECWIPLLAKHTESPLFEGSLVVPLDCEWIWHCHRLNPITYHSDCKAMYGKILDNKNVVSYSEGNSFEKKTKDVWEMLYPNESFLLNMNDVANENNKEEVTEVEKFTTYDLASAVQRQSLFYSQVSESHMCNDLYLEGAVAKYKGFLHLIRRDMEKGIDNFLAPTYAIDLIWHTHQLHPVSYYNDLVTLVGTVIGHDDTVTDRTIGHKLDVGFTTTINIWSQMYGYRYPIITQNKASPCGKPFQSKANNLNITQIETSPCGKPVDGNNSACIVAQNKISPCGKPVKISESPCGKPGEWNISPCGKPVESKGSPCGKPGYSKVSPCGKPMESKVNGEIVTHTKASPCGKPGETNCSNYIVTQTRPSPCGKPEESKASPCGKPVVSKDNACIVATIMASPCGKLDKNMVSPCGKPVASKVSPCGKPGESEASPCGKPVVNKASANIVARINISPCGKPGKTMTGPFGKTLLDNKVIDCIITSSEASPCGIPCESNASVFNIHGSNASACIVHKSNTCPCGIPCA